MKRTKEQKGITLVALVVTIIVLLILAGITLSTVLGNNGLIQKTKSAAQAYQNAAAQEQIELENVEETIMQQMGRSANSLIGKISVGDYIRYNPTEGVDDIFGLLQYTSPVGQLAIKKDGDYVIHEYINNPNGFIDNREYSEAFKLLDEDGNFVTDGYTVVQNDAGNGYAEQKFEAKSSNNLWRVLDDGYVSGEVKIISENEIYTKDNSTFDRNFYLGGILGYINGGTELDNICAIFGHGKGAKEARCITMDDIDNLTGFDKTQYGYNVSRRVGGDINKSWKNTVYSYNGTLDIGTATEQKAKIYDMLIKRNNTNYRDYYVKTPCVGVTNHDLERRRAAQFGYHKVHFNEVSWDSSYEASATYDEDDNKNEHGFPISSGINPVVTLKAGVEAKGGDGTKNNPWTFQ